MGKKDIEINLKPKDGTYDFTMKFLIGKVTTFADTGSWDAFNAILALLIYGIVLFLNIEDFMDLDSICIFMTKNHVPTFLADIY